MIRSLETRYWERPEMWENEVDIMVEMLEDVYYNALYTSTIH
jgi:hypothetical protein